MTRTDISAIGVEVEKRMMPHLKDMAKLTAMEVIEQHVVKCANQRSKPIRAAVTIITLLIAALGVWVAAH